MLQDASQDDNAALAAKLVQARHELLKVYAELPPAYWQCEQFPYLKVINPPLWEWAHVAWFQEYWCHRHDFERDIPVYPSMLGEADDWVDSRKVDHELRWRTGHPSKQVVEDYMQRTLALTLASLEKRAPEGLYPFRLALYHETMHIEALLMTLCTIGLPLQSSTEPLFNPGESSGVPVLQPLPTNAPGDDVSVPAGTHWVGSDAGSLHFVFDNERVAHRLELQDFVIAAYPVSRGQFLDFARRGYQDESVWRPAGWAWVQKQSGRQRQWLDALFDRLDAPVQMVSAHEAEAFCRFAGRRLPSEFEWEVAAGLRAIAMTGQVWEWTSSAFLPYGGFMADPYREYSQPWFGDHRVLKGGSWATHPDLKRPAFRNFYLPERTDVFAGFRTCAL